MEGLLLLIYIYINKDVKWYPTGTPLNVYE